MLRCKDNLKCEIFFVKEKQKNVVQGEVTFVNIEVDCLKMEDAIIDVKCEVLVLQVEQKVVCKQLEDMKNKSVISLWPKPIVHPILNNKSKTYILVKHCEFCNRGYHCHDIDDNSSFLQTHIPPILFKKTS
jgi:hypothetical protein